MAGAAQADCPKTVNTKISMPNLHRSRLFIHRIVITLRFPFLFRFFLIHYYITNAP